MRKKRYIVVPRTEGIKETGLKTGKRTLKFGTKTARWIDDPAEAREIDTTYGLKGSGDVWVEQDENLEWHENHDGNTDGRNVGIHHYTFAGVDTSHFTTRKDGDVRVVGEVTYIWKGKWIPRYELGGRKRTNRNAKAAQRAEVRSGISTNKSNPKSVL